MSHWHGEIDSLNHRRSSTSPEVKSPANSGMDFSSFTFSVVSFSTTGAVTKLQIPKTLSFKKFMLIGLGILEETGALLGLFNTIYEAHPIGANPSGKRFFHTIAIEL